MEQRECFSNEDEIFLYLDHELNPERTGFLDRHIKSCSLCEFKFQVYVQLKAKVKAQISASSAPEQLKISIRKQLHSPIVKPQLNFWEYFGAAFRGRPLAPIGAIAVLIFLLFSAVSLIPRKGNTMPLVTAMVQEHYEYMAGFEGRDGIKSCDADQITEWVSSHSGLNIGLKTCQKPLSLVGACALDEEDYQATCIFLEEDDKRVTLFMLKSMPEKLYGPKILTVNSIRVLCGRCTDMNYVAWQGNGVFYILVGDLSEQSLLALADNII